MVLELRYIRTRNDRAKRSIYPLRSIMNESPNYGMSRFIPTSAYSKNLPHPSAACFRAFKV